MTLIRRIVAASIVLAAAFVLGPATAYAAQPVLLVDAPAVLVTPARLELALPDNTDRLSGSLIVANNGAATANVTIQIVDFTVQRSAYQFLPAGSTPYSIAAAISLSVSHATLRPGVQLPVSYTLQLPAPHRPLAGAIIVATDAPSAAAIPGGSGALSLIEQVAVPVLAIPTNAGGLAEQLRLTVAPAGLNLPWVAEGGPLAVTAHLRNSGNVIGRADSWTEFSSFGRTFLRAEAPPAVVLPGAQATTTSDTRAAVVNSLEKVDTAPLVCLCHVVVTSRLILLDQASPTVTQDGYVLIAPWRLLAVVLAVLGGVYVGWWRVRRRREGVKCP